MSVKIDLDKLQRDTEEQQSNYTFDGNVGTMKEEATILLKLLELIVEYECALEYYAFHHETLEPIKESTAYKALQEKKRILGE